MVEPAVLVIGEAVVDVIRAPGQPSRISPGGSPLNVAVGLRRLGLPTQLHTHYGKDPYGDVIAAHLAENGVTVSGGRVPRPTSVAEAAIGEDGSATYEFRMRWDPPRLESAAAPRLAVHIGSIAAVLEPGAAVVRAAVQALRSRTTVSFDPNLRPTILGGRAEIHERVADLVAQAHIVKGSEEDIDWLHPGKGAAQVAREWLRLGPSLVAITLGRAGTLVLTRAGALDVAAPVTHVADTVGAGDSFMAGLLTALADRRLLGHSSAASLKEIDMQTTSAVVDFAVRCAAITVARHGADLPRRHELIDAADLHRP